MSFGMNSGYNGWSMSNRAAEAYDNFRMPLSKWTKNLIIMAVEYEVEDNKAEINFDIENLNKLTKKELVDLLIIYKEWHHTSSYCNSTDFYGVDEVTLENLTNAKIEEIIATRIKTPRIKKEKVVVPNLYVTALVKFDYWSGTRNHPKKEVVEMAVHYRSDDKMVNCGYYGNKRLSSLCVKDKIVQKTKYAKKEKLQKK